MSQKHYTRNTVTTKDGRPIGRVEGDTTTFPPIKYDVSEIRRALAVLAEPGQVTELRALQVSTSTYRRPHTESGYFDDLEKLAQAAETLSGKATGVYVTLNPVRPELLARAHNRVRVAESGDLTGDTHVIERRWLLVDVDAERASGISSTEGELIHALETARAIRDVLTSLGWPLPVFGCSGNGAHLLYRVDLPANDGGLLKRVLAALAFWWDNEQVKIDKSVYNPSRISKLYGTLACKGDNTPDRPHRLAYLTDIPKPLEVVSRDSLEEYAKTLPEEPKTERREYQNTHKTFDLETWIVEHGLDVGERGDWNGGDKWVFTACPFNAAHRDKAAYLLRFPNGAIAAGCHHNSCSGKDWHALRDVVEPGWRDAKRPAVNRELPPPPEEPPFNDDFPNEPPKPPQENTNKPIVGLLTADQILTTDWPEPVWAVPGLLPVGLTILAGAPKVGKSWLALQIAQAVAAGGMALGQKVERGAVFYLALEDSPRRLQERMEKQSWTRGLDADFLTIGNFAERIGDLRNGGAERLAGQIERRAYRFVVVDTLSRAVWGKQNEAEAMTAWLQPIQNVAHHLNCAVLFVDHHHKGIGDSSDVIADILGSTAKGAMCDTALGLYRERGKAGAKLAITGRDLEERTLEIKMDWLTGVWQLDMSGEGITAQQADLLDVLEQIGAATVSEIAEAVDRNRGNVYKQLAELEKKNKVRQIREKWEVVK